MIDKEDRYSIITTAIGAVLLLAATAFLVFKWTSLPDQVITNYGVTGQPERYGSPGNLIKLLVVGWGMFWVLTFIEMNPKFAQVRFKVKEEYKEKAGMIVTRMIGVIKVILAFHFSYTVVASIKDLVMPEWYMIVFYLALFDVAVLNLGRVFRMRK
ncbi:MAG: DUF1648 domain-containing protein [Eubacterium sp.]|nr:DUF1648 domain-containing protein [Eubacterium sp.]